LSESQSKPQYGVDAPEFICGLFAAGIILPIVAHFLPPFKPFGRKVSAVGPALRAVGLANLTLGTAMLAYGLRGKFNIRDLMLSMITWKGDEAVLDVGTGRGLLAIGAAKRLTTGKVTGIDIWNAKDLSGNTLENALVNVRLEGVQDRVEFRSEDVRDLSFAEGTFDVILSLLCLHNIEGKEGRKERDVACREIARVLKPGGTAVIGDYIKTADYAEAFTRAGLTVESRASHLRQAYGLMWVVVVRKAA
jgi:ubiquinone/menaquinone biosynthesis C-methylase UbiE